MERSAEYKVQAVEQLIQARPEIAGLQSYEYLRNNNASQRDAFIAGTSELDLMYPELQADTINRLGEQSFTALSQLLSGERTLKTETLFRAIEYRYSELYLLATAVQMNDKTVSDEERKAASERFREASEALYGTPELGTFNTLTEQMILGECKNQSDNTSLRAELRSLIGQLSDERHEPFKADAADVKRLNVLIHERFDPLLDHIESGSTYDVPGMVEVLDVALQKVGGHDLGWRVVTVPDASSLSVSAHQKLIEVGEKRASAEGDDLKGYVLHELGVHAMRSMIAERAGFTAAAYGMDGYLDFEEAFGTALQDALAGKFVDHGFVYYVMAGLTQGLDNHPPRAMREVYEIMWRTKALQAAKGLELTTEQIAKAQKTAFTNAMRLFRGTDTKTPGVIYLKDLSYFRGQELVWSELAKVTTQADLDPFFAGKLDLTQPDHREVAEAILATTA